MHWIRVVLLAAVLALPVTSVYADSLAGSSQDCGTYRWDGSLTKGRTSTMIASYNHTVGCFTYIGFTVIGADREAMAADPARERSWQFRECETAGQQAVVGHFKYYRGIDIDPASVRVSCTLHTGAD